MQRIIFPAKGSIKTPSIYDSNETTLSDSYVAITTLDLSYVTTYTSWYHASMSMENAFLKVENMAIVV